MSWQKGMSFSNCSNLEAKKVIQFYATYAESFQLPNPGGQRL